MQDDSLTSSSLKVITAIVEPSLANALTDQNFQCERQRFFVADRVDHVQGSKPVFNLAVGLKDFRSK
jgi:glutaminyl-tRNA synthetase